MYVVIYGSTVSLLKHFLCIMFSVLWPVSYLQLTFGDNFAIHMMLCRVICLFMLMLFFCSFCLGNSEEEDVVVKSVLCSFLCIFGISGSIMCVVNSNEILFYVTS